MCNFDSKLKKREFTDSERYAVFSVHGDRCYLNGEFLTLKTMEVDHILPESLQGDPEKLAHVLKEYGLPENFNLQSYANWKPSCRKCNLEKLNSVFRPTPIIQRHLDEAIAKADKAEKRATRRITDKKAAAAWNEITRAKERGELSDDLRAAIVDFARFHFTQSSDGEAGPSLESVEQPLQLTPVIAVIKEEEGFKIVRGPYGVGVMHDAVRAGGPAACGVCGGTAFNGARCILCGNMDDD